MKIGIDAGALCVDDERLKVGVYRVVYNLLRVLGKSDKINRYFLYSFAPIDRGVMKTFGNGMENKVLRPTNGWFSFRLPLELRLHPVDMFLGVSQAIPSSASYTIGFIYDVAFLYHPEAYPGSYEKLKSQTKDVIERSKQIITISYAVKADIEKQYALHNKRITVAYPGVDARFTPEGKAYKGENPYFLFVGALKPGKNIPRLIRAFSEFQKHSHKPFDLYLVGGDYWKDSKINETVKSLDLSKSVKILGHVTDIDLPLYYRGAEAFVSPSLHEGFCLPAIEAMSCECPVVGSTTGAMPEIIGNCGLLVDPLDVQSIARVLAKILDPKLKKTFIRKGIIRSQTYSWEAFGKTVLSAIHEKTDTA